MEVFIIWVGFSVACAIWASKLNRSGPAYFFVAMIVSPLVCALILLAQGRAPERDPATGEEIRLGICPFCRETVRRNAIKCKHCQSTLEPLTD